VTIEEAGVIDQAPILDYTKIASEALRKAFGVSSLTFH
jgi:hypothetical protein